jgi:Xaa-Pro aminopeptidase
MMNDTNMMNGAKQKLFLAEQKAKELFNTAEERGLIVAGKRESELSAEIVILAKDVFGIENYWHKKIVRTGANTLYPYSGNPPDLVIQKDDILFLDFGPIFEGWEADLGRTYVIGNDPVKWKLKRDVEAAWQEANAWRLQQTSLTGAAYFDYATQLAKRYGWEFEGEIAGHIVGHFPHEQLAPGDMGLDIHPDNHSDILQPDNNGNSRHWILELQFVDKSNNIGAYFEQLMH